MLWYARIVVELCAHHDDLIELADICEVVHPCSQAKHEELIHSCTATWLLELLHLQAKIRVPLCACCGLQVQRFHAGGHKSLAAHGVLMFSECARAYPLLLPLCISALTWLGVHVSMVWLRHSNRHGCMGGQHTWVALHRHIRQPCTTYGLRQVGEGRKEAKALQSTLHVNHTTAECSIRAT